MDWAENKARELMPCIAHDDRWCAECSDRPAIVEALREAKNDGLEAAFDACQSVLAQRENAASEFSANGMHHLASNNYLQALGASLCSQAIHKLKEPTG